MSLAPEVSYLHRDSLRFKAVLLVSAYRILVFLTCTPVSLKILRDRMCYPSCNTAHRYAHGWTYLRG